MEEQAILDDLVSDWVSLGVTFVGDAPGVTALYVYVSSELGVVHPELFVEQDGRVLYPSDVTGTDTSIERITRLHDLQIADLRAAERRFDELAIPRPTEYRVYYEPGTGKLDVALARELVYAHDENRDPIEGIVDWIGDRAPRLY